MVVAPFEPPNIESERKQKITPVSRYWRECEPVSLMLITVFHDATEGVMPPSPS